jgi:hypothetical protein
LDVSGGFESQLFFADHAINLRVDFQDGEIERGIQPPGQHIVTYCGIRQPGQWAIANAWFNGISSNFARGKCPVDVEIGKAALLALSR